MTLSSHKTDLCTPNLIAMTKHDFLREVYFDFCLKNDMPKHPSNAPDGGYLSAGDVLYSSRKYQLTKHQKDWLKCFIEIWNAMDTLWFEKMSQEVS